MSTSHPNTEIKYRTCHLCEAMCGLEIEIANQEVVSIRGHEADIYSKGHICPKGVALKELHNDPDRLKQPVKRTPEGWVKISWKEAFDTIEREIKRVRKQYGNESIGTYTGNPTVHNTGTALTLYDTINSINTRNRYASHSLDSVPHMLVNQLMFGHAVLAPIPDIERLDYMLILGANPLASNGSFMSTPDFKGKMRAIQDRGGKVVVIDPRRTETAQKASEHYFIQPERDVLLLLGIINELFRREAVVASRVLQFTDHLEELKQIASDYPIEKISSATGISADQIHHIVDDLIKHSNVAVYGRMGVSVQSYGSLCQWLISCINILLGQLDEEGGVLFTLPAIDYVSLMAHESKIFRYQSRVHGYKEIVGEFPTATLAEEMLTPGEGQIKAFISIAGNPARSAPNSALFEEALASLEFMFAVDMYINETTRHANIILPPAVGLETMHYSFVLHMVATRNTTKFSPPPLPIAPGQKYDWEIMSELQLRLFDGNWIQWIKNQITARIPPRLKLDLALRTGPYGVWGGRLFRGDGLSLSRLEQRPEGIDLAPLRPIFPERLYTADKRIKLVPKEMADEVKVVAGLVDQGADSEFPLQLIGRRHLRSNNSWMHNLPVLAGGSRRCTALVHPTDAATFGIQDGHSIRVSSPCGEIEIEAELSEDIIQGTVSIPHGWGHTDTAIKQQFAQQNAGANINQLMDHTRLDGLSYNAAFSGQPIKIESLGSQKN